MNYYKNQNLKNFIAFYYKTKCDTLPSCSYLEKELNITESVLRTLLNTFVDCRYIYKNGREYTIFQTKRNFTKHTQVKDKGDYVVYSTPDYKISFNKMELDLLAPNFKINTIEDLIYILFLFTMELKIAILPIIYFKNKKLWFKKECHSYRNNSILFMCEFTQHSDNICLTNVRPQ